jgi:hypothetical protein
MLYLIQENLYREFHQERLIDTLERLKLEYSFLKIKPFIDEIEFDTNRKDVFIFGAVKAAHLAKKYGWNPGSFYNENHDYVVYSKYYKENMLNCDSKIQKISEPIEVDGPFFVRPTGDTKLFKGEIYENNKLWDFSLSYYLSQEKSNPDALIQVAPVKDIYQEYRCFIVNGEVITSSMYKLGNHVLYKECFEEDILKFANQMTSIYQLAPAFVMDICRIKDGLRIVECNCINCSGFYDINIQKLLISLEENFTK